MKGERGSQVESIKQEDAVYTVEQVAEILQVHKDTVQEWVDLRKLASVKIGHKTVRILQSDIDRFVRDRRREADSLE